MIIDFDDIQTWHPRLTSRLAGFVPADLDRRLKDKQPKFVQEALDHVFAVADRDALIAQTLAWIADNSLAAYHGTRLAPTDKASVQARGLLPLQAEQRRDRLVRALSTHPRWAEVSTRLDDLLAKHGEGKCAGGRLNQVHLTLSRAGLTQGFSHYLSYGSEFDQHVAHALLDEDGAKWLARDGDAFVLKAVIPGGRAIEAAHLCFTLQDMLDRGEVPNLVRPLLESWAFRIADATYRTSSLQLDAGLRFKETVPSDWIVDFQRV